MNVGIIGAGHIAEKMAVTLNRLDGFTPYGIASRNIDKARDFSEKYNFLHYYGSYEELVKDPSVELIYIATPHSLHYEHMMLCLKYNKPVLCEKTLTPDSNQTIDIYKKFEEKNLLCQEALWTSFLPSRKIINDLLFNQKVIGEIKSMEAYFEHSLLHKERVVKKSLGGGVALDIGIYPISFTLRTFGFNYESYKIISKEYFNDVDIKEKIEFKYSSGLISTCIVDGTKIKRKTVRIYGTDGHITLNSCTHPEIISIYKNGKLTRRINIKSMINGFEYQLIECKKMIDEHKIECPSWTHEQSIITSKILDSIIGNKK